jgi:DNA polymerase III subunit delta'
LANREEVRLARAEVLRIPTHTNTLTNALVAARDLIDAATERADSRTRDQDADERTSMARGLGVENPQRVPKWAAPQFKELKQVQEKRAKRALRDELDRDLLDLMSYYRDVLAVQSSSSVDLVNSELSPDIERLARSGSAESTLRSMEAIATARERVDASVAPLLAIEELMLALKSG